MSSVLIRDFVLWVFLYTFSKQFALDDIISENKPVIQDVKKCLKRLSDWESSDDHEGLFEEVLEEALNRMDWGSQR